MKKILLFSAAILLGCSFSFTQNLSLVYDGNPISANQEIEKYGLANAGEMVIEFEVTNNGSSDLTVLAKKVENSIIPGSVNTFCWAGLCYAPNVYVSPLSMVIPAGTTTAVGDFSGHYDPQSNEGQSSISYVFFDLNNPNDSVMVTVLYTTGTIGIAANLIKDFNISNPYPNPANQVVNFDYTLNKYPNASLKVYSLIGSLVNEKAITSESGTVQMKTDYLPEGFYFYVLSSSGKELKSGRFMVNR
jgi:hypothetical protein